MKYPIVLLGPTAEGGSIVPIVGSELGDLSGITLLGVTGPDCILERSDDGVTGWTTVAYPETINGGFLRLTRTDDSADATLISVSQPDPEPAGGLPVNGTTGQILSKASSADNDAQWVTRGFVPASGTVGQILAKTDTGDFAVGWVAPPSGGGGGTSGPILLAPPPRFAMGPGDGFASNKQVKRIRISPLKSGVVSWLEVPFTILAADIYSVYASNFNDSGLLDVTGGGITCEVIAGGRTRIRFAPVMLAPPSKIDFTFSANRSIPMRPDYSDVPSDDAIYAFFDDTSNQQIGYVDIVLSSDATTVFNGPAGSYVLPVVTYKTTNISKLQTGYTEVYAPTSGAPVLRFFSGDAFYEVPFVLGS